MPFRFGTIRIVTIGRCLAAFSLGVAGTVRAQTTAAPAISRLAWLGGCWEQRGDARLVEEQWLAPAGGTMIGVSRTLSRNTTRSWEFLRIAPVAGVLTYVAQPSGQAETPFAASIINDTLAVFENPAHDFPQRIEYRHVTPDSLVARISATRDGKVQAMDIPMRRCRASLPR